MPALPATVQALADLIGARVEGDPSAAVTSLAPIEQAQPGQVTFVKDPRRAAALAECPAAAVLVAEDLEIDRPPAAALLRVGDVDVAVARMLAHLAGEPDTPPVGVPPSAVVDPSAELAANVAVGPGVVIGAGSSVAAGTALCAGVKLGAGVQVGENCVLWENVVVRRGCRIGDRVRIGPNSTIGYDGFGYYMRDGVHHHVPHAGTVVIEDDVDLGANVCVDRAKFGATRIGAGSKVDNLVQIAHNVQLGQGCVLAAQVGIAGSTELGRYVVLGGSTGVRDNIRVGDGVQCAAYAAIARDVPPGEKMMGIPAVPAGQCLRIFRSWPKLPDLLKRVQSLEKRLQALDSSADDD